MQAIAIELALVELDSSEQLNVRAQSAGFRAEWYRPLQVTLKAYLPQSTTRIPACTFAWPITRNVVAVVQCRPSDGPVRFHVSALSRKDYTHWIGDPLAIVERTIIDWEASGNLETLHWERQLPPRRSIEDVRKVLARVKAHALEEGADVEAQQVTERDANAESPMLLGGVQVLVDGGRLVFERQEPDPELIKSIWTLLPDSTRSDLWPATFAFNSNLPFDVLVVDKVNPQEFPGYTTEDNAADYPEGRYELHLQIAAESGSQDELDALFRRRSWKETWRLALTLLLLVTGLALVSRLFTADDQTSSRQLTVMEQQAIVGASVVTMTEPLHTVGVALNAREVWNKLAHP